MRWLVLLALAQNLNVTPIESRQDGVRVPQRVLQRQWVVDCRNNMTCGVDGGILFLSASGGAGGKVAEAYAADASITAQTATVAGSAFAADASITAQVFDHNPTDCAATEYATAIDSAGNLTCSTPPGGSGGISYAEATAASLAGF